MVGVMSHRVRPLPKDLRSLSCLPRERLSDGHLVGSQLKV
jgi:hypothetical protein